MKRQRTTAFTLFEVMISMLIMTTAILSTVALLPIGLRAQQLARSKMFAASTAVTLMYQFHNQLPTFEGVSRLSPSYTGIPGTSTTSTAQQPYDGWADQLRNQSIHASAYQANAEQSLCGWFNGVLPLPMEIAHRLDSDNDEIAQILDQGGMLFYPDPNFLAGLNQGASADKTIQITPAPEIQKLVFTFTGYPQQNALSTFPVDSYPYYENYPFPPAWLSLQASGRESRLLQLTPYVPSSNSRGGAQVGGGRSGITLAGRETGDWTWSAALVNFDDAGHAAYIPVTWGTPMRPGQDAATAPSPSSLQGGQPNTGNVIQWCATKALDDPNSSDEWYKDDNGVAFYEGNGFYQGRNWRYFANANGSTNNLWLNGNGQQPLNDPYWSKTDPYTGVAYNTEWAYFCFQRLSGVDADFVGFPASNYTNTDQQNNTTVPGIAVTQVVSDASWPGVPWPAKITASPINITPSNTFPSHPPASFYRAGWLPIRGLLTNANAAVYHGLEGQYPNPSWYDTGGANQYWAPYAWTHADNGGESGNNTWSMDANNTNSWYANLWNLACDAAIPQTCQPTATYEMRANYRDRAIDLWQAVMPTHSNLAQLTKNPDATTHPNPFYTGGSFTVAGESNNLSPTYYGSLVDESIGGTMVDCCKYEYPPMELDRFQFLLPSQLAAADWPIHPAQILALSYLAHAAMMVTGYSPPFSQQLPQGGYNAMDLQKIAWEALNWTYQATPEELQVDSNFGGAVAMPYPQVPSGQLNVHNVALSESANVPNVSQTMVAGKMAVQPANQGIWKDAMLCAADAPVGQMYIDVCNTTAYDWVVFPGDEIVLEPSYYQWQYRSGRTAIPGNAGWWGQGDPHDELPGPDTTWNSWFPLAYDSDGSVGGLQTYPYPNMNYQLQTFRVQSVQALSTISPDLVSGPVYTYGNAPPQSAPNSAPPGPVYGAIPPAIHPTVGPILAGQYMGYPMHPGAVFPTTAFTPGLPGLRLTLTVSLPQYPNNYYDAHYNPGSVGSWATGKGGSGWDATSVHKGSLIRRICNPADIAFARKVYEMCIQWAAAYSAEFPNDFGAPRMTNHPTMMDQPLSMFDLFYDAGNGGLPGTAIRKVQNPMTTAGPASNESFYRWLVPNNWVPQTWFWNQTVSDTGQHDNSHMGPGWARNSYFDQMVHNNQLQSPGATSNYDQVHFWLTKPFSPFVRTRSIKFWSVDWKSYQDAEMVPSSPIDFAKHNRFPRPMTGGAAGYSGISPNGDYGYATADLPDGHSPLCGNPESLYVWTDATRSNRYGDVVGGQTAGYLYQNWTESFNTPMAYNAEPNLANPPNNAPVTKPVTADVHLGHWGADRNGNGKLDIGPIPPGTRMRAITVGEFLYYDPVLRLNLSN